MVKCFTLRTAALFAVVGGTLALAATAEATTPTWKVRALPSLSGDFSEAAALNDADVVVGVSLVRDGRYEFSHAALWKGSSITDLGVLPGYQDSAATDINNRGQVVGYAEDTRPSPPAYRAFMWSRGTMTDLGFRFAAAINNDGVVVGWDDGPTGPRAVVWRHGVVTPIIVDGAVESYATAVNGRGEVLVEAYTQTGEHSLVWNNGTLTEVASNGGVGGINARGQVVGYAYGSDSHDHGFLWTRGITTDLGANVYASSIDDSGAVVGSFTSGGVQHGLFWQDGTLVDLGASVVPTDVNDRADLAGSDTTDGHAVLLIRTS